MMNLLLLFCLHVAHATPPSPADVMSRAAPGELILSYKGGSALHIPLEGVRAEVRKILPLRCSDSHIYVEFAETWHGTQIQRSCQTALILSVEKSRLRLVEQRRFACDDDGAPEANDQSYFHPFHVAKDKGAPFFKDGPKDSDECL